MINRKCERCKEITGTLHGGKKLRKNFYVRTVCKKELRVEKSNYHKWKKTNFISFYKNIKIMSVIYLIGSILMAFLLVHLYIILGLMKYPFQDQN